MTARDRGYLLNHLADLMDQHKEELATIESIGAVQFSRLSEFHLDRLLAIRNKN